MNVLFFFFFSSFLSPFFSSSCDTDRKKKNLNLKQAASYVLTGINKEEKKTATKRELALGKCEKRTSRRVQNKKKKSW